MKDTKTEEKNKHNNIDQVDMCWLIALSTSAGGIIIWIALVFTDFISKL